jgi:ribonuclease HII
LILSFQTDSKTLKEEQREELFESLKVNSSIRWEVDVIRPKDLSAKMLKKVCLAFVLIEFILGLVILIDSPIVSGRKLI